VVELEVERAALHTFHTIKIKRQVIEQKGVTSRYIPEQKVGVIKVSSFLYEQEKTSDAVLRELENLKSQGEVQGVVLDLRNNPGGFLEEAINVAGLFVPRGSIIVQTKGQGKDRLSARRSKNHPAISNLPVIVLINAGSASASEIVASALMDQNAALIIGERSFGKASVQEVQTRGTTIIKLTTARYYAPEGYTVQVYGVVPDVTISDEPDGTFPPRYREEDMWKHLPELKQRDNDSVRNSWIDLLKKDVGDNLKAEEYLEQHKNDAEKPDYMLQRAMSFFPALRRHPRP
jgi:C-terminal peptidase prc